MGLDLFDRPSTADSGHRQDFDLYETPAWMTLSLLAHHPIAREAVVLEPCAGGCAIASVLWRSGFSRILTNDLDTRQPCLLHGDAADLNFWSVADPRVTGGPRFSSAYRIVPWSSPTPAVPGNGRPTMGCAVADPRTGFGPGTHNNVLHITPWDDPSKTITSGDHPSGGALCVADPRPHYSRDGKSVYRTTGEYGVVPWGASSGAVTATGQHDNGRWSVADPREIVKQSGHIDKRLTFELPAATARLVAFIRALDGTYHRPFTTLELAALQSLIDPAEIFELHGASDSAWRERIGNAVPPDAAESIASVMAQTLLLAWAGETFLLSATPVWVQPLVIALSVKSEAIA